MLYVSFKTYQNVVGDDDSWFRLTQTVQFGSGSNHLEKVGFRTFLLGIYKQVIEQVGHRPFTNSLSIFASILEYLLDAGQTPGSVFSKTTMWSYVINRRACDATFGSNHPSPRSDDLSATSSCINWPPSYDHHFHDFPRLGLFDLKFSAVFRNEMTVKKPGCFKLTNAFCVFENEILRSHINPHI